MASNDIEIVMVAQASAKHPRNGGADLIDLKDGSILIARMKIFSSELEFPAGDDAPSDIITTISHDGGKTWGNERTLIERGPNDTAAYMPNFLRLRNGNILFGYEMYHRFVQGEEKSISGYMRTSRDECKTFSEPATIFSHSAHHGGSSSDFRQISSGRIVIPICYMTGAALQDEGKGLAPTDTSVAGSFTSDDEGRTWNECQSYIDLPMRGSMEPKIEELEDGRLLMVMRTQLGSVFQSFSEDGGCTWSKAQTTGLQSPESCPGLLRIPQSGDLLLIWNDSPYDPQFDHYGVRSPLSVAISKDEGLTWEKSKAIESDPEWEFTNPASIVTSQGKLLIVYEASKYATLVPPGKLGRTRMHLKLAIVDLDWLYQ